MIGLSVETGNREVVRKLVRRTSIALLGISLSSCVGVRGMVVSGRCYHAPYIEFHRFAISENKIVGHMFHSLLKYRIGLMRTTFCPICLRKTRDFDSFSFQPPICKPSSFHLPLSTESLCLALQLAHQAHSRMAQGTVFPLSPVEIL
jgi:hypothetical protein